MEQQTDIEKLKELVEAARAYLDNDDETYPPPGLIDGIANFDLSRLAAAAEYAEASSDEYDTNDPSSKRSFDTFHAYLRLRKGGK